MVDILEKMFSGIGSGLLTILSGIGTLIKSLVIGVFSILDGVLGGDDNSSECVPQTEIVEHYVEMHRDSAQQEFHEQMLSMTLQKSGVNFNKLRPEMDSAIFVVVSVYHTAMNDDEYKPLITSANDYEEHSEKSAHYVGAALDFRIKDMGTLENRKQIAQMVRDNLGYRYTVLHEDIGLDNEHLHVQLRNGTYNRNAVWK
jgi:hypothetical protein